MQQSLKCLDNLWYSVTQVDLFGKGLGDPGPHPLAVWFCRALPPRDTVFSQCTWGQTMAQAQKLTFYWWLSGSRSSILDFFWLYRLNNLFLAAHLFCSYGCSNSVEFSVNSLECYFWLGEEFSEFGERVFVFLGQWGRLWQWQLTVHQSIILPLRME